VSSDLNLIRLFDFYLALAFLVSTFVRIRQYEAIVRLVRAVPGRWPRLFQLVRQHHTLFLTWSTALPALVALALSVVHTLACRLVWPHADLRLSDLVELWPVVPLLLLTGGAMIGLDVYFNVSVGAIDRPLLEKYFDQAEYWLRSWAAPVVRVFTFGRINPRKMVAVEVRKALEDASRLLNASLWWWSLQVGLRIAFGLSLWLTYAWGVARTERTAPEPVATRSWGILQAGAVPLAQRSPPLDIRSRFQSMSALTLFHRTTPAVAACALLAATTPAAAWELGGPLYTNRIPPASLSGYNLDDPSPSYYGGGRYREYYNYGRGYGLANFPGPLPDYPRWPYGHPPAKGVAVPAPVLVPVPGQPPTAPVVRLTVRVPDAAELWIEGAKTKQTGPVRQFVSPPLAAGQQYVFTLRARWPEGAQVAEQVQQILVSAGQAFEVRFPAAAARETLPAPRPYSAPIGQ
jgi:uncharacterized protein (TIGR03000 family)